VDSARISVLMHIPRVIDLCGDIPIQLVHYALCGHAGTSDVRGSFEDELWTIRDQLYDTMSPDEIREKARLERIAMNMDSTARVSLKVLSIVANGNPAVTEALAARMLTARAQREENRLLPAEDTSVHINAPAGVAAAEDMEEDVHNGSDNDSDDPFALETRWKHVHHIHA
jgi:hypothetical protein